uniref:Uncharacterized protein n=1 Tax=Panagrolaimus sp. ES5 TaxID=591445 RepID=A0AC34FZH2_9BILA
MKKELVQLKKKEVKRTFEVGEICKNLESKMASLKDALAEENTELQEKLARMNDQLLKATNECEEYKTKAERS